MSKRLIVTHKAPDLDAITATWLLKQFDTQHYGDAKIEFVSAGEKLDDNKIEELSISKDKIVYVDTGLGEFDHHQDDRGKQRLSASSLVLDHICKIHPEKKDDEALNFLVDFVTGIDHFEEIYWPESDSERYSFMLHELIHGLEHLEYHDDDSKLHFGFTCLDSVYGTLKSHFIARKIIADRAKKFFIKDLKCLSISSNNDDTVKIAQKMGYAVVLRKDPDEGHIRVKARPDADINLEALYEKVRNTDTEGSWYFHPSGKMLLNGSGKNKHAASPLTLEQMINLLKEIYEK
ncbi:MAG: hypothetical protein ABFQ62_04175 [Patescibacteria group bacterium]